MIDLSKLMNEDAELYLLEDIIYHPGKLTEVSGIMKPEYFGNEHNGIIYQAVLKRKEQGYPIDFIPIIKDCEDSVPITHFNLFIDRNPLTPRTFYGTSGIEAAKEIIEHHKKREMYKLIYSAGQNTTGNIREVIDNLFIQAREVLDISSDRPSGDIKHILRRRQEMIEFYAKLHADNPGKEFLGYETGIPELDSMTNGLLPRATWIIGGYTSKGKTTLLNTLLNNFLKQRLNCIWFSVEEETEDILTKLIGVETRTSSIRQMKGNLGLEESTRIREYGEALEKTNLKIYRVRNIQDIRYYLDIHTKEWEYHVIFIDYLQALKSKLKTVYDRMTEIAFELPEIRSKYKLAVISSSQIGNEAVGEGYKREKIGFKGSGDLPGASDISIELSTTPKDQKYNSDGYKYFTAIIKKQRLGPVGAVRLMFNDTWTRVIENPDQVMEEKKL